MRRAIALVGSLIVISACVDDGGTPPQTRVPTAPALAGSNSSSSGTTTATTSSSSPPSSSSGQGFRVCNLSGVEVEVAKALNRTAEGGPPDIVSEGWYQLDPGECVSLWSGPLEYRHYLLYAQSKPNNREWSGNLPVCVDRQPFTLRGGLCPAGQYQRNFFQVDTGESKGWTQNLR
jgi:uncharacterized membrane protein